jgi:hypothetical protein
MPARHQLRGSDRSRARPAFRRPSRRGILTGMSTRPRSQAGPAMTLGNMRANGVRSLDVCCWQCHHRAFLSADPWPDHVPVNDPKASLCVFDVSGFRPNVVLELGLALAEKDEESVIITYDARKPRGKGKQEWLLSDIGHLDRKTYKTLSQVDQKIEDNLDKVPAIKNCKGLVEEAKRTTSVPDKYLEMALKVLHGMREKGHHTDQQIEALIKGSGVRRSTLGALLKKHKLAHRQKGRGRWILTE